MEHLFDFKKTTFNISKRTLNDLINIRSIYEYKSKEITIKQNHNENNCGNSDAIKMNVQAICLRNKKKFVFKLLNNKRTISSNKRLKLKTSLNQLKLKLSTSNVRFSELQVKQGLLYFYLCNSNGFIRNLEKKKVAELLKCTVKTVENNNRLFEFHNIFEAKKDSAGTIFVRIINYEKQYAKKEDGGYGYAVFPTSILKRILNESELRVNELKLLLKSLLKFDYNKERNQTTKFLRNELMHFTSSKYWNEKPLKELLNKLNNMFKDLYTAFYKKDEGLKVVMEDKLHGKTIRDNLLRENKAKIKLFIDKIENIFDRSEEFAKALIEDTKVVLKPDEKKPSLKTAEKILDSFGQLSIEYGYAALETELSKIPNLEYGSLVNIGGYIRNKIEETFDINKACLGIV